MLHISDKIKILFLESQNMNSLTITFSPFQMRNIPRFNIYIHTTIISLSYILTQLFIKMELNILSSHYLSNILLIKKPTSLAKVFYNFFIFYF